MRDCQLNGDQRWRRQVTHKMGKPVTYIRKMIISINNLPANVARHRMTIRTSHLVALSR